MKERGSIESQFDSIIGDDLLIDPVLKKILDEARQYQLMIDDAPNVTDDDCRAMLDDLNAHWPYAGQVIKVSGTVDSWRELGAESENSHVYGPIEVYDQPMISEGFMVVTMNDTGARKIGLQFLQQRQNEFVNNMLEVSRSFRAFASPDKVFLSDYTYSKDYAQLRAEYYLPDEMALLHERLFDTENPEDWLNPLADIEFNVEEQVETEGYQALVEFVNQHFSLGRNGLPSIITVSPGVIKVIEDGNTLIAPVSTQGRNYCHPMSLQLHNIHTITAENEAETDTSKLIWNLEASVLGGDGEWRHLAIPLTILDSMQSLPDPRADTE